MRTIKSPQRRRTDPFQALRRLAQSDPASAEIVRDALMFDQKLRHYEPNLEVLDRNFVVDHLPEQINRAQRPGSTISVYVLDFDNFKSYNDAYGHTAGDIALAQIASAISLSVDPRNGDFMGRWGGEEFVMVKRDLDFDVFRKYGKRLVEAARNRKIALPHDLAHRFAGACYNDKKDYQEITVSVGGAYFPLAKLSELVEKADARAGIAKQQGRNKFVCAGLEKRLA